MKISVFFLFSLLMTSCDGFETKKLEKETIISEQLNTFNWNNVDQYPSFQICDDLEEKLDKKACFETEITNYFFESLNNEDLIVTERIDDTIYLDLLISELGQVTIINRKINPHTRAILPKIDTLLDESVKKMPKIYPAIKRGQQVRTQFTLPILIEMDSVY
jgi:hypothetical protein